jgi:hypothetical protein
MGRGGEARPIATRVRGPKISLALIAAIPSAYPDAGTVSNRLMRLLPSSRGPTVPRRPKLGFNGLLSTRLAVGIALALIFNIQLILMIR